LNKQQALEAVKLMREHSKQRNFQQSVDLTINFKGLDFKKPDSAFKIELPLPHGFESKGGDVKAIVFVRDKEFASQIKDKVARVVMEHEIEGIKKKEVEKLAGEFDVILAQGPTMLTVAKHMGQILAPKGKMPKPITTDTNALDKALAQASTNIKVTNKKQKTTPLVHVKIGLESFTDEQLADNAFAVYSKVEEALPQKRLNVRSVLLKLSMGVPVKAGSKPEVKLKPVKEKKPKEKGKAKPAKAPAKKEAKAEAPKAKPEVKAEAKPEVKAEEKPVEAPKEAPKAEAPKAEEPKEEKA
jgi:large subunit ribosomal protein L1